MRLLPHSMRGFQKQRIRKYAYYSEKWETAIMKDLDSGRETTLTEADDGYMLGDVSASGNGILYNKVFICNNLYDTSVIREETVLGK